MRNGHKANHLRSGAIVQGHSNLTEIQKASELFWRVGINPSKIALGFGFYGRAFTLQDPSCTKPGCPFSVSQPRENYFSQVPSYKLARLTIGVM
jgi:GH18 family chitinase